MTDNQKEMLKAAGISDEDYDYCYISDINQIFTPLKNENGKIVKTGEKVYKDYLTPIPTEPTDTDKLKIRVEAIESALINLI